MWNKRNWQYQYEGWNLSKVFVFKEHVVHPSCDTACTQVCGQLTQFDVAVIARVQRTKVYHATHNYCREKKQGEHSQSGQN